MNTKCSENKALRLRGFCGEAVCSLNSLDLCTSAKFSLQHGLQQEFGSLRPCLDQPDNWLMVYGRGKAT